MLAHRAGEFGAIASKVFLDDAVEITSSDFVNVHACILRVETITLAQNEIYIQNGIDNYCQNGIVVFDP